MAYIVNENGRAVITKGATAPTLSQVDFDRAHDVYRMALRGDRQAARLWHDWEAASPADARLVAQYDAVMKSEQASARDAVDAMLTKAESTGMYGRSGRKSRGEMKAKQAAPKPPKQSMKAMFRADLASPDPRIRETARRALGQ